jgi:chromate transporter
VEKKKGIKFFVQLFWSTFTLSAFTFGGGYVIVPLMRKKFVERYKWIEEKEMLDLTAIAQSAPGMIAVNASILVSYRLAGVAGAFFTIIGTVLPPLITISVISLFYEAFKQSPAVAAVLRGMSAGVAAVVADAIVKMGKNVIGEKSIFGILVMAASFAAVFIFRVDVKLIILVCALAGIANAFYSRIRHKSEQEGGKSA